MHSSWSNEVNQIQFTRFDTVSGQILHSGEVPESFIELQGSDIVLGKFDGKDSYIVAGHVMPRPENTAYLEGTTLKNVPAPSILKINGKSYPCSDTRVDLEFTYPGVYVIEIDSFPHKPARFTVVR